METKIILISGKKYHGKDTTAYLLGEYLTINKGITWVSIPFAESLKAACKEIFLLSHNQVVDPIDKEIVDPRWGKTPRQIMQEMGTEVGRAIHPNVWVINTILKAKRLLDSRDDALVFIPDCRFPNEIELPKEIIGKDKVLSIRVVRDNLPPSGFDTHPSETALDNYNNFDFMIKNNGTIEDLNNNIKLIAEKIK